MKWRRQPTRRGRSGRLSIDEQRREIERLVRQTPSLKPVLSQICDDAYAVARLQALRATRLSEKTISEANPFTVADVWLEI